MPAGWREDRTTERNGFPIGGDGGIGSLCTSADRAFVSYGANVRRGGLGSPITSRSGVIPSVDNGPNLSRAEVLFRGESLQHLGFACTADVEFGAQVELLSRCAGKAGSIGEVDLDFGFGRMAQHQPHRANCLAFNIGNLDLPTVHVSAPSRGNAPY